MTTETRCKTTAEMLAEAPDRWGALLFRFERDIYWLCDYRTPAEQDQHIARIAEVVRTRLQHEYRWTHEAATAVAVEYAKTLKIRITRPAHFNPAAHRHQPEK